MAQVFNSISVGPFGSVVMGPEHGLEGASFAGGVGAQGAEYPMPDGRATPDNCAEWDKFLAQFVGGKATEWEPFTQCSDTGRIQSIFVNPLDCSITLVLINVVCNDAAGNQRPTQPSSEIYRKCWNASPCVDGAIQIASLYCEPVYIHRPNSSPGAAQSTQACTSLPYGDGLKTAQVVHERPEAERPSETQTESSVSLVTELLAADRTKAAASLAQEAIIDRTTTTVRAVAAKINRRLLSELAAALQSNQTSLEMGGQEFLNIISVELKGQGDQNGFSRILHTEDYLSHEVLMTALAMACIELINNDLACQRGITKRLSGTLVNKTKSEIRTDGLGISGRSLDVRTGFSFRFEFVDSSAPVPRASGHSPGFIAQTVPLASDLNDYTREQLASGWQFDQL